MARPHCCRRVQGKPACDAFRPSRGGCRGQPVLLGLDELEALRLSELEGFEQVPAAELMGVSRPTFGRILAVARRKIADALVNGRELRIGGGPVREEGSSLFRCASCGYEWTGCGPDGRCPNCDGKNPEPCGCGARAPAGDECCRGKASKPGGRRRT